MATEPEEVIALSHADMMRLAEMRLTGASILHRARQHSGAFYLAGYAIELALKSIIARSRFGGIWPARNVFEEGYTHRLDRLIELAGLQGMLRAMAFSEEEFEDNWLTVRKWRETSRYAYSSAMRASGMLLAVRQRRIGVLSWLKTL